MQELYVCDHCGEEFPLEETLLVEGDRLCRHCAAGLTALCDECGIRIYLEHDEGDSNRFLCASCRERYYTRCDRCNTLIHNENVYEYDNEYLCEDCYDERLPFFSFSEMVSRIRGLLFEVKIIV